MRSFFTRSVLAAWSLLASGAAAQVVTSSADGGPGSLRQALADAEADPGFSEITFDPGVFTGALPGTNTITLVSPLAVDDADGVLIDGSGIPGGVTISGGNSVRLIAQAADSALGLSALTLTAGNSTSAGGNGGAIRNEGEIGLYCCTLHGNTAGAGAGGAISSSGTGNRLYMENCTVTGNTAGTGALHLNASMWSVFIHCTIVQNHGTIASGGTGGLILSSGSLVGMQNTILAGNTAAGTSPPDINGGSTNTIVLEGVNLIGVRSGGLQDQLVAGLPNASGHYIGTTAAPIAPDLKPLARTRGPTPVMEPNRTSIVMDKIADTPLQTDQSGEARVDHGLAEIGALEARHVLAEAAWDVRISWKAGLGIGAAAGGAATLSVSGATHRAYTSDVIAFRDDTASPDNQGHFTHRQRLWPMNNQTPQGMIDDDDDEFFMNARTHITIAAEDDYTLGFASDDGARLRIFSTDGSANPVFISSSALNPDHPMPVSFSNTLTHDGGTSFSDTLGVVHLLPGTYLLEYDYIEGSGFSHAEVFAARGAKTVVDAAFRLIGDREAPLVLGPPALTEAGWSMQVFRNGTDSLEDGIAASYDTNPGTFLPPEIMSLRFTSSADHPERDPMSFKLEGSLVTDEWVTIATGSTQLPNARLTAGPMIPLDNVSRYQRLRITFPTVRDAATATAMQVGEVAMFDAFGTRFGTGLAPLPVPPGSLGNQGPEMAQDGDPSTAFAHPAVLAAGFTLVSGDGIPQVISVATAPTLHLHDPENSEPELGHGEAFDPFPGNLAGDDDHFTTVSRAMIRITSPGDYTFSAAASSDVRLRIIGSRGWVVKHAGTGTASALIDGFQCLGTAGDVLGQVHLHAGTYEIEVFQHDNTGPASVGLWAAHGAHDRHGVQSARYFGLLGNGTPGTQSEGSVPFALGRPPGETRPVNDDFDRASTLVGSDVAAFGSNLDATVESGEDFGWSQTHSVWWSWTAPSTGPVQVDTFGSECDTSLFVFTGASKEALVFVDGRTVSDIGENAALPFLAVAGTTYHFKVSVNQGSAPGRLLLHLGPANTPPNDDFANAIHLGAASPVVVTGNILNAQAEDGEPTYPNGEFPTVNVWYRWTAPDTGKYLVDTRGSGFSAIPAVFAGDTRPGLVVPGQSNGFKDGAGYTLLNAVAGTTYSIAVDVGFIGDDPRYCLNIARVGRHQLFDSSIREDEDTLMLTYLGDTAYQRTLRLTPGSNAPGLLPALASTTSEEGVQFAGLASVTMAAITPVANGFGNVTFSQAMTFDRVPVTLDFHLTVSPVNDPPAFAVGPDPATRSVSPQTVANWAVGISAGPANESTQTLQFSIVSNSNPALFAAPVVISPEGTLTFIPAPNKTGSATLTARLRDNGGTANGGVDFTEKTFTIIASSPYANWAASNFGGATSKLGPNDDFDGDGLTNLVEYAFLYPPATGSAPPVPGSGLQPMLPRYQAGTLSYTRWSGTTEAGLNYIIEESSDLATWTAFFGSPTMIITYDEIQSFTYAVPVGGGQRFFRVAVSLAE